MEVKPTGKTIKYINVNSNYISYGKGCYGTALLRMFLNSRRKKEGNGIGMDYKDGINPYTSGVRIYFSCS